MSDSYREAVDTPPRRAQSTVLGIILLIGMVSIGSLGLFIVASDAISSTEHQSESERVEQAFVELSQEMSDASISNDTSNSLDFEVGEKGAVTRDETGEVHLKEPDGKSFIGPMTFGTIEYTGDDGSKLAYEAGAVFREDGEETQVVSSPAFHYNSETFTLTFPIVDIDSKERNLHSGDISFEKNNTNSTSRVGENQRVQIEITSEYWKGWESYFIEETGAPWAVTTEDEPGTNLKTVSVELGQISHPSEFSQGARAGGDINWDGGGAGVVEGPVMATGSVDNSGNYEDGYVEDADELENLDDEIRDRINEAEEDYDDVPSEGIESEEYYSGEDLTIDNDINLDEGDAILVVDGDIDIEDDVTVKNHGGENTLYVYTNGTFDMDNNEMEPEGSEKDPERIQIYGDSSFEFKISGNGYYEGVVYAPSSGDGSEITMSGNPQVYGSVVAGTVELSGNQGLVHDDSLAELEPNVNSTVQAPPDLIYLNLAHHTINLDSS